VQIIYSSVFVKEYRRLPSKIRMLAEKKEKMFLNDPHNPSLKTHALTGKLLGWWSFSINYQYRILFRFEDKNTAWFLEIGTHDVYK
jgi:addiction module RelE/StbE family toxin